MIRLSHGAGGVETEELLEKLIFSRVALKKVGEGGLGLDFPDDAAAIPIGEKKWLVVTVDAYTVYPPFFPGGDIGLLAASGSINDVLMLGGRPVALLDSIVVEEGFPLADLERITQSLISTLERLGVALIGGDFKVMPKGQVDKIVITTVGVGVAEGKIIVDRPRPGDVVVVTGPVGDHGAVVLAERLGLGGGPKSDVRPLMDLYPLIEKYREAINAARDPTRGGLAMVLNDWAKAGGVAIVVDQSKVRVRPETRAVADYAGIDPLNLASEGAAVFSVPGAVAEDFLRDLRAAGFPDAEIIGEVREGGRYKGVVLARTEVGGYRIVEPPRGELVPRIC
jgi:hydrogenase expression/formation protein HypE|nr:MAG: hydrogenase assembly protein HupF [Thermoproteus sp. AZ2]